MAARRPVAVVTGASRGIGRATAAALARVGYDVVVTGRSTTERPDRRLAGTLEETRADVEREGMRGVVVAADLASPGGVEAVVGATLSAFGRCDVLVNNAAISYVGKFLDVSVERWHKATNVNLLSPVALVHELLPGMLERGSGCIVNVSSRASVVDPTPGVPYAVAKAGLERFSLALGRELAGSGVHCVCVRIDELVLTEGVVVSRPRAPQQARLVATDMARALRFVVANAAELAATVTTVAELRAMGAFA